MILIQCLTRFFACGVLLLLANCANPSATPKLDPSGKSINPQPPGTYAHFTAEPTYPKNHSVWKDESLLSRTDPSNSHLKINLSTQRGLLMNGEEVVIDYPICYGTKSHPTPPGIYPITEKIIAKSSNRYGKMYDAEGNLIDGDADASKDAIPEGSKFVGAPMRYWMRLTPDGVGHHIGYSASHGYICGPSGMIPTVFDKVKIGIIVMFA